jgi:epoxyqueuosine reductase
MSYMEELLEERLDVTRMLPGARSVLMVADLYSRATPDAPLPGGFARIARYARGADYHATIKRRLHRLADALRTRFPGHEFRSFVDTGPVLEREHAARAGLGWIGKHTLLINPALGSYLLLGGIATTLELVSADAGAPAFPVPDHCGSCTRCIDACPTGAITPYSVDARRCISYLTIEHEGPIDGALERNMEGWLFGCDVCQEVCPFNAPGGHGGAHAAMHPSYRPEAGAGPSLSLARVRAWGAAEHAKVVGGTALKRASLSMLRRNASIAGAMPGDPSEP